MCTPDVERWKALLTPTQYQVAEFLMRGISNRKRIGRELGIHEATVRGHLSRIYRRLEVSDSTSAAVMLLTGRVG